ncbi:hypothetical protein L596_003418 [Steinernema carpocapsae]|uniref:Uncharacterized protein n=1 Tax=Steinernema carpocapsae TaxID=34508 RepID=A0A4U8UVI4_STECR|nr:hypothetical protein L596_003418 [Steinernema carpocapsae]
MRHAGDKAVQPCGINLYGRTSFRQVQSPLGSATSPGGLCARVPSRSAGRSDFLRKGLFRPASPALHGYFCSCQFRRKTLSKTPCATTSSKPNYTARSTPLFSTRAPQARRTWPPQKSRGYQVRHHPEQFGIPVETMSRRRSAERLTSLDTKKDVKRHSVGGYSMDCVDTPEDRAATRIQAEIRGFLARKQVQHMKEESANAATKIQAHIRGFLTRKHLDEKGLLSPSRSRSSIHSSRSDGLDAP